MLNLLYIGFFFALFSLNMNFDAYLFSCVGISFSVHLHHSLNWVVANFDCHISFLVQSVYFVV